MCLRFFMFLLPFCILITSCESRPSVDQGDPDLAAQGADLSAEVSLDEGALVDAAAEQDMPAVALPSIESFDPLLRPIEAETSAKELKPFDTTWAFTKGDAPFAYIIDTRSRTNSREDVVEGEGKIRLDFEPKEERAVVRMEFSGEDIPPQYVPSTNVIDQEGVIQKREDKNTNLATVLPYFFPSTTKSLSLGETTLVPISIPMFIGVSSGSLDGVAELTPERVVRYDDELLVEIMVRYDLDEMKGDEEVLKMVGGVEGRAILYYDATKQRYHSGQVSIGMRIDYTGTLMEGIIMLSLGSPTLIAKTYYAYVLDR